MKTLKHIKEEFTKVNLIGMNMPEEVVLESQGKSLLGPTIPSTKEMPVMLLFRRISYRMYPNKQVVALYYSKMVDKYLSIPFGPTGNLNINEATILDSLDEDWQSVNRKDKTDGLSQKAVNAYRRENPGSKLQTAVTEKNPKGKRASRRKAFCSRMGGMKKRLTSAKTARDPDSRINKALRRWNCEEDFKMRLTLLREERMNEGWRDTLISVGKSMPGYQDKEASKEAWKKGDYAGAIKSQAKALGKAALTGAAVAVGARALPAVGRAAMSAARAGGRALPSLAKAAGDALTAKRETTPETIIQTTAGKGTAKTKSSFDVSQGSRMRSAAAREIGTSKKVNENKISDLRNMINEGIDNIDININGREVTLNTNMAKRILEVYDSVNTKNKKIVEGMLNEDLESFKKLLNFSIKA
jgi:hypothetical protein